MLTEPVVIVTGASSGIGRETARLFAERRARVVLAARDRDALERTAASRTAPRDQFLVVPTDVTVADEVRRLVAATMARWGRIDILVNNAGLGLRAAVRDTDLADARRVLEVNVFGALRCLQAVVPVMRQQAPDPRGVRGQIVNVGSVVSRLAIPQNSVYCASKFALRAINDAVRLELRAAGIDVILVMPGYTDTAFFERMIRSPGPPRVSSMTGQDPRAVAAAIARACRRRHREVVLTVPGRVGVWLHRLLPRGLDWALARTRPNP